MSLTDGARVKVLPGAHAAGDPEASVVAYSAEPRPGTLERSTPDFDGDLCVVFDDSPECCEGRCGNGKGSTYVLAEFVKPLAPFAIGDRVVPTDYTREVYDPRLDGKVGTVEEVYGSGLKVRFPGTGVAGYGVDLWALCEDDVEAAPVEPSIGAASVTVSIDVKVDAAPLREAAARLLALADSLEGVTA